MNLQSIRPTSGADLFQLHAAIQGEDWDRALPSALPDKLLLELARDFREAEAVLLGGEHHDGNLAPPTLAVLARVMRHPERSKQDALQLEIPEDVFQNALHAYQWALEREIVSRIVGRGANQDSESLMTALRRAAVGSS